MNVREATEKDIPAIVNLLKLSLGELLMPKSKQFWSWKHQENPFGPSPVLVMEDQEKLVGVRALMQWRWRYQGNIWRALRAVDTATHPDYQNKGIFKKLTLAMVERCASEGYHFIFNTPNARSKPGYLKMGWQEVGKLSVRINPVLHPLYWLKPTNDLQIKEEHKHWTREKLSSWVDQLSLPSLHTSYSSTFLLWRYARSPVAEYGWISDRDQELLVIFRLKITRKRRELRLVEILSPTPKVEKRSFLWVLHQLKKAYRPQFVSWSGLWECPKPAVALISNKIGPLVTKRDLSINRNIFDTINFNHWTPSLGDLELF